MKKNPRELLQLARNALERAGANPVMAEATAEHLLLAEAQGLPSHGISRVPVYCAFLRNGRADGAARPKMLADRAATCLLDNCDGLPYETSSGKKAIFGTDPVAFAFPRKDADPIVVDLALTTVVRGKIMLAMRSPEPRSAPRPIRSSPSRATSRASATPFSPSTRARSPGRHATSSASRPW